MKESLVDTIRLEVLGLGEPGPHSRPSFLVILEQGNCEWSLSEAALEPVWLVFLLQTLVLIKQSTVMESFAPDMRGLEGPFTPCGAASLPIPSRGSATALPDFSGPPFAVLAAGYLCTDVACLAVILMVHAASAGPCAASS